MQLRKHLLALSIIVTAVVSCKVTQNSTSLPYTIAYSSEESGNIEIYLTDEEVRSKIQVTNHPGVDRYVAWSPDGKRIAFYGKYDERKTWSIHTMNIDGTNRKRLTHAKHQWDSSPAWSPDGRKIVFSRSYRNAEGKWTEQIWIMNSDGSEQKQLKSLTGGGPYFTKDGRIVYHSQTETSEICIADADGSDMRKLTNNDAEDWHPEVSPDGKQIAFISNRDGNQEIYTMNLDGSNQKRLTHNEVDDWYPSWSPDGLRIIFSSTKDEEPNIYIMNKDGSSLKSLIKNGKNPAWLKIQDAQ